MITALTITALLLHELSGETCVGRIETLYGNAVEAVQTAHFACSGEISFQFVVTARGVQGRSTSRQEGTVNLAAAEKVLGRLTTNQSGSAILTISAKRVPEVQCRMDYNVEPAAEKSQPTDLR